jgi:hypothetical protein
MFQNGYSFEFIADCLLHLSVDELKEIEAEVNGHKEDIQDDKGTEK